jgi:hypothetical protein
VRSNHTILTNTQPMKNKARIVKARGKGRKVHEYRNTREATDTRYADNYDGIFRKSSPKKSN